MTKMSLRQAQLRKPRPTLFAVNVTVLVPLWRRRFTNPAKGDLQPAFTNKESGDIRRSQLTRY